MLVAYDGSEFRGFALQPGQRTVASVLTAAIETIVRHPVELVCAGRTDRGVHAWGQVVHADVDPGRFEPDRFSKSVNRMCGAPLVLRHVEPAEPGFHARFSAVGRVYRYRILNTPVADPFQRAFAWHVSDPLDLAALRLASDPLLGKQDFSSFCRRDRTRPAETLVRSVRRAHWRDRGSGRLEFEIVGSAFCHQMVRSIVGTLVDMGRGRRRPGEMRSILAARDRNIAPSPAPPHGLTLHAVHYPAERPASEVWWQDGFEVPPLARPEGPQQAGPEGPQQEGTPVRLP